MTALGAKARCVDITPNGIPPAAGIVPTCHWLGECKRRASCFWARFHKWPQRSDARVASVDDQADLFADEVAS